MENLTDIAEFRSPSLAPILPEDSQVNPEVYGAELAFWLTGELANRGVVTSYPISEDWGWFIEFSAASGAIFAVHCGNVDGSREHWFLQLRRFGRKMFGRDLPPYSEAQPLVEALRRVLEEAPGVSQLEWRYTGEPVE